jgi:crossover junction endodeoxyribonuclease RuvC
MIVAGIDPGLDGAIAFLDAEDLTVADMPVLLLNRGGKRKRELDPHGVARLLRTTSIDHAFVEAVGARPGQGVTSMFSLGRSLGIIIGVLAALDIPLTMASPAAWKRSLGVPKAKDGARARASQLLPAAAAQWPLKKHHGRAEAALLALHGSRSTCRSTTYEKTDPCVPRCCARKES